MARRLLPLILCCLLAATGCRIRETPAETGIRTQTLLLGNAAEPADLDPHTSTVLSDQNLLMALFEGLTALDEKTSQPVAAAAERWEHSADGLTWTFHLRPGLKWSNGDPLTAQDFIDSWRRALTPALAADNAWYLYAIRGAEDYNAGRTKDPSALGLAALDAGTIVITLQQPLPYLPALVSLPAWFPVNPRVLARFNALAERGTGWTRPGNLVGNGPFALKEWTPNARIVMDRNPHHWQAGSTRLQHLVFFPIEKADDEERAFRAGQLHVTFNLPIAKLAAWRRQDVARLRVDPTLQSVFLRFNTTRPPLNDPRVRRALSLAIDRDTLARTVLQGSRPAAHTLTPPGTGGFQPRAAVSNDFGAARRLLASAGFAGGNGFPTLELQARNDEIHPRLAEAMQAVWQRELGLRVSIAQVEQKTWIQNQQTLNYAISTAAWTADFPDPVTFLGLFAANGTYNWTGWANPAFDTLLQRAAASVDPGARQEIFQEAERLLLEEAPVAPLHFGAQTYLIHPAVRGWEPSLLIFRRYQLIHLSD